MRVKELISHLRKMPQDIDVVYSCDSEGNNYSEFDYAPILGMYLSENKFGDGDFMDEDNVKQFPRFKKGRKVVCIN